MAEKQPSSGEQSGTSNQEAFNDSPDAARERLEQLQAAGREAAEKHEHKDVESLHEDVKDKAKLATETNVEDTAPNGGHMAMVGTQKELKKQSYDRTMKQVRSKLPAAERGLSKVIHQPLVNSISEVSGKTALRPSGVLGGSICAFLGSLGLLYVSKHYGFTYNYLMLFLFFVGGFFVGLLIEAVCRLVFRKQAA